MTQRINVLVTGGAGYIGSHAVLALRDRGWPVAVIDNLTTGFRFAVPDGVPFYEGDIADGALLARIFAEQGTRAIMHFAGSVVVPESVENPLKYYDNNTGRSRALIVAAVAAGIPHFIFSSTATAYGVQDVSPLGEDLPLQPINPYGWSKVMTERMLADASAAYGFNHCVLRYFNVAGADPAGRSGQSTAGATHLIKVAVEAALGMRENVSVFGKDYDTPDGTGIRDYVHVSDLAEAHVLALEALIADRHIAHHELRLRARIHGARGARRSRSGDQPAHRAAHGAAPRRRSAAPGRRYHSHPRHAALATAPCRPRRDRRPCARLGAAAGRHPRACLTSPHPAASRRA